QGGVKAMILSGTAAPIATVVVVSPITAVVATGYTVRQNLQPVAADAENVASRAFDLDKVVRIRPDAIEPDDEIAVQWIIRCHRIDQPVIGIVDREPRGQQAEPGSLQTNGDAATVIASFEAIKIDVLVGGDVGLNREIAGIAVTERPQQGGG